MGHTQRQLRDELDLLRRQRDRYVQAAHHGKTRKHALRHLLNAERLSEEIQALQDALVQLSGSEEDVTMPVLLDDRTVIHRTHR